MGHDLGGGAHGYGCSLTRVRVVNLPLVFGGFGT